MAKIRITDIDKILEERIEESYEDKYQCKIESFVVIDLATIDIEINDGTDIAWLTFEFHEVYKEGEETEWSRYKDYSNTFTALIKGTSWGELNDDIEVIEVTHE